VVEVVSAALCGRGRMGMAARARGGRKGRHRDAREWVRAAIADAIAHASATGITLRAAALEAERVALAAFFVIPRACSPVA